jgi:membrane-associated phospholipid phosphatase
MRRKLSKLSLFRLDLDRWVTIYLVVSGIYPLLRMEIYPRPYLLATIHLFAALIIWFIPPILRRSKRTPIIFIGETYLPPMFSIFYIEMEHLGLVFREFNNPIDPTLIKLEEVIFKCQPSIVWSQNWDWPWFHELMEFAYFAYYFIPLATILVIFRCKLRTRNQKWERLRAFIRDLGATMLICYSLYTFFPAWGPKYFQLGPIKVDGWVFTDIMNYIHTHGAILGAAFPSSHVAATMISWWHVWTLSPRHRIWMSLLFALLCMSTVYCRYHYIVDVIGGLLVAGMVIALGHYFGEKGRRLPWQK